MYIAHISISGVCGVWGGELQPVQHQVPQGEGVGCQELSPHGRWIQEQGYQSTTSHLLVGVGLKLFRFVYVLIFQAVKHFGSL